MTQVNLYDHEVKKIYSTIDGIQRKWYGKSNSSDNLNHLQREIVGRLEDLGFKAIVDVTPCLEGQPIDVRIEDRVDKHTFDWEKKQQEVKKSKK